MCGKTKCAWKLSRMVPLRTRLSLKLHQSPAVRQCVGPEHTNIMRGGSGDSYRMICGERYLLQAIDLRSSGIFMKVWGILAEPGPLISSYRDTGGQASTVMSEHMYLTAHSVAESQPSLGLINPISTPFLSWVHIFVGIWIWLGSFPLLAEDTFTLQLR